MGVSIEMNDLSIVHDTSRSDSSIRSSVYQGTWSGGPAALQPSPVRWQPFHQVMTAKKLK